jgi:hypothetical protein
VVKEAVQFGCRAFRDRGCSRGWRAEPGSTRRRPIAAGHGNALLPESQRRQRGSPSDHGQHGQLHLGSRRMVAVSHASARRAQRHPESGRRGPRPSEPGPPG